VSADRDYVDIRSMSEGHDRQCAPDDVVAHQQLGEFDEPAKE
jgi:hypothetical protein